MIGVLLALSIALPSPSVAAGNRPWIGVLGGLSTYSMSDVNDEIGSINAGLAGTGLKMDNIKDGGQVGAVLGLELPTGLSLGLGYEYLTGSSEVGSANGSLKFDFPAHAYRAFAQYTIKGPGVSGLHVGGSVGMVSSAGKATLLVSAVGTASGDTKGSAPLIEGYLGGDWWASRGFALTGSAGFRYANIDEIKMNDQIVYVTPGNKEALDYTGVFLRAGVKFSLTK
jgi:hypothetical protein